MFEKVSLPKGKGNYMIIQSGLLAGEIHSFEEMEFFLRQFHTGFSVFCVACDIYYLLHKIRLFFHYFLGDLTKCHRFYVHIQSFLGDVEEGYSSTPCVFIRLFLISMILN